VKEKTVSVWLKKDCWKDSISQVWGKSLKRKTSSSVSRQTEIALDRVCEDRYQWDPNMVSLCEYIRQHC
jgi:hypothetical protein